MSDSTQDSLALVLQERFWADHDSGGIRPLTDYLALYPGHEEVVAIEYVATLANVRRGDNESSDGDGNRQMIGPYRLIEEIGRGGQGVVWLAEDTRLGRKVALKSLIGLGPGAEIHLARFRREAALASKLEHPGICGVHDTGIEGGIPFIAMRFVDGETLAQRLSRLRSEATTADSGSFMSFDEDEDDQSLDEVKVSSTSIDRTELDRLIGVFEKVAAALHAAHEVGIVHRDIKPGNIMVARSGEPVLLDFGLAHDDSDAGPSLTRTGDLFGTPAYMSPEQITGRRIKLDRRSDVYSLGVTLYECLTTRRPFEGPTREALYQTILSKEAPSARTLNRNIVPDLEVVLQCAMEKDRDKRYQTAADFAEDLRRVREGEPILAKKISVFGRAWRWSKRRPTAAALLVVLAFGIPAISGLGVWYWTHLDDVRAQEQVAREQAVENALETGFYELRHGDRGSAVAAFESALTFDPMSVESAVGLALTHLASLAPDHRDLTPAENALAVLERSERCGVSRGVLARTKALVLNVLGREAESVVVMEAADPIDGAVMWFLEGQREITIGHDLREGSPASLEAYARAESLLKRAVAASPRARRAYHLELAHVAGHLDSTEAPVIADAIAKLWPGSATAWRWIAVATKRNDLPRAAKAAEEAIRLDPTLGSAHEILGLIHAAQGHTVDAIAELRRAVELAPRRAAPLRSLGDYLRRVDRFEEAEAAFRAAIDLEPLDPLAHSELGALLLVTGRTKEAHAVLEKLVRGNPTLVIPRTNLGMSLVDSGRFEEAREQLEEATRLDPNFDLAFQNLGVVLVRLNKFEEAAAALREAIRLAPETAKSHANLSGILFRLGNVEGAEAACLEAIRLDPKVEYAHVNLASILKNKGRLDDAIQACRDELALRPMNASAHSLLGLIHLSRGEDDEAEARLVEAVRLDPSDVRARISLAELHMKSGKTREVMTSLRAVIDVAPDYAPAHCNLGVALRSVGRLAEAFESVRVGHDLQSGNGGASPDPSSEMLEYFTLARADQLYGRGRIDEANELLEKTLAANRNMKRIEARIEAKRGWTATPEEMQEDLEKQLDRNPDDIIATTSLARLLVAPDGTSGPHDPKRALALAREAVALTERLDPEALEILAMALFATGDAPAAVAAQQEVLSLLDGTDRGDVKLASAKAALERYSGSNGTGDRK